MIWRRGKHILVEFTPAEARALLRAVSNTLDIYTDALKILGQKRSVSAAYRARDKIVTAVQK